MSQTLTVSPAGPGPLVRVSHGAPRGQHEGCTGCAVPRLRPHRRARPLGSRSHPGRRNRRRRHLRPGPRRVLRPAGRCYPPAPIPPQDPGPPYPPGGCGCFRNPGLKAWSPRTILGTKVVF